MHKALRRQDITFEDKDQALRDDVRTLGRLVGELLKEQGGDELFDVVGEHPNYAPLFLRQWLEKDSQLRKVEQEELAPRISQWVSRVEELVSQERRSGIDLPLALLSLSWVYWGMNASPGFIGPLLGLDPDSPEYQRRLREHAKAVTRRMLEARPSHAQEKGGRS